MFFQKSPTNTSNITVGFIKAAPKYKFLTIAVGSVITIAGVSAFLITSKRASETTPTKETATTASGNKATPSANNPQSQTQPGSNAGAPSTSNKPNSTSQNSTTPAPSTTTPGTPSSPPPSSPPPSNPSCALPKYPTTACTGVPSGVTLSSYTGSLIISTPGQVIDGKLINGTLDIRAHDVVIRNSQINGIVVNDNTATRYRFTIEDSYVKGDTSGCNSWGNGAIGVSNYTARRVRITGFPDGFRVAGSSIRIEDSHVTLCSANPNDHSDGIQAYGAAGGTNIVISHNTIDQRAVTNGAATAPIFIPTDSAAQGNDGITVSITNNLVAGGGYSIRAFGTRPMTVTTFTGNKVVNNTWEYGPLDVTCSSIQSFSGNAVVTFDWTTGTILSQVRTLNDCP